MSKVCTVYVVDGAVAFQLLYTSIIVVRPIAIESGEQQRLPELKHVSFLPLLSLPAASATARAWKILPAMLNRKLCNPCTIPTSTTKPAQHQRTPLSLFSSMTFISNLY